MDHLKDDEGFQAAMRVMEAMGFDTMEFNHLSAEPLEEQFWNQFDGMYDLTELQMKEDLHLIVTDPSNRTKVEALLAHHDNQLE